MTSRRALVIVDLQRGFINEHTKHLISPIEAFQNQFEHSIATRFYHRPGSTLCRLLGIEGFAKGSPETELAFRPKPGTHVIEKPTYSCVTSDFLALLRSRELREATLCGVDTDQCVLIIAAELLQHDIVPIVRADLTASAAGPDYTESGLFLLRRLIGKEQVVLS
ncbi:MAG: cysteine hydrolase [Candidatus Eremiobacteraeota bacterium]|nr:cysteine hydrolase [Candidatus Eremiobacteraeota bacterium]